MAKKMERLEFKDFRKYNKLNHKELLVYNTLVFIIGNNLVPKMVHITGIIKLCKEKGFILNYEQVRYLLRKLIKKGYIERWTVQLGQQKHNYFRIRF